jgi:uncharacterized protein with FMN-binding domain
MKSTARVLVAALALLALAGCNDSSFLKKIPAPQPDLSLRADGVYHGEYRIVLPPGQFVGTSSAAVDVTVKDHRFNAVKATSIDGKKPVPGVDAYITRVLDTQSISVDGISGASYNMKAVQMAIVKAFP